MRPAATGPGVATAALYRYCPDRETLVAAFPGAGSDTVPAEIAELLDPRIRPTLHRMFAARPPSPALSFDDLLTTGVGLLLDGVAVRHRSATE
ncbi:Uncharacterised protein [Nocardia otitidiscaviarum]|uniref:Uncharacterized protein n=1 Tax=Nocardia otitidiscaviarum TaxID=1823 RepID=A0A379JHJ6_9NOCA|nr:hypothetical protein [Nocardia otitidiscaviarum]SUD47884.1 Uncharacterised protein [Nocardia otitidiscaviarum]